jgi:tetratricopeptide (TPR) repeat protein
MANLGRMPDAAAMFQRAVDADPRNADARRNLANALFELRAADQAIGHAKAAVELRPEDPGAHNVLGRCLAATGRYPEAIAELERAARLAPDDATVSGDLEKLRRLLHH